MAELTGFCSSVNLGGLLLQALLEFWPRTRINPMDEDENEGIHGEDEKAKPTRPPQSVFFVPLSVSLGASYTRIVCASTVNGEQENRVQKGNGYFQVPPHTPVIFGEAGGRTLFR